MPVRTDFGNLFNCLRSRLGIFCVTIFFSKDCAVGWFFHNNKKTCPICRTEIDLNNLRTQLDGKDLKRKKPTPTAPISYDDTFNLFP